MKRMFKILIPVVLVATAASGIVFAQQMRRERPTPETMQRLQDGRIAMITGALKLTEPQAKLWAPVEAQMRARHATRVKQMQEWAEKRQKGETSAAKAGEKPGDQAPARIPLPDRLDQMSARMAQAAEQSKAFATVFRPFHESLTEEQKAVIGPLMADMGAKHHGGRGHRFGGHRGGGQVPL